MFVDSISLSPQAAPALLQTVPAVEATGFMWQEEQMPGDTGPGQKEERAHTGVLFRSAGISGESAPAGPLPSRNTPSAARNDAAHERGGYRGVFSVEGDRWYDQLFALRMDENMDGMTDVQDTGMQSMLVIRVLAGIVPLVEAAAPGRWSRQPFPPPHTLWYRLWFYRSSRPRNGMDR